MALPTISSWSLQSPDTTNWVPNISTRGLVKWVPGGGVITSTPPVFQGASDTTVWIPSISNAGLISLTSASPVSTWKWATLVDGNSKTWYSAVNSLNVPRFVQKISLEMADLSWNANTEPDLAGYKLYLGQYPSINTDVVTTGLVTQATILTELNNDGSFHFTISAFDTSANESAQSSPVSKRIVRVPGQFIRRKL